MKSFSANISKEDSELLIMAKHKLKEDILFKKLRKPINTLNKIYDNEEDYERLYITKELKGNLND